ncbi:MAG: CamS family sex pheromone protein [Bacilli bacterium]|nr:CamS family sex pheromone protein [Bacilli bacterium]
MKKLLLIGLMLLFLTGCRDDDNIVRKLEMDFDNEYYQVATPYKKSISGNYVINNVLNNYDINDIENSFMMLSSNYFKTNNSLYQEGQYLNREELKELLSKEKLNKNNPIEINGSMIKPTYITSVYEQNYLTNNGNLKGITIGLIFNPYQAYEGEYGSYDYEEVDLDVLESIIFDRANEVVKYLKNKLGLEKTKIVVGVYLQNRPNAMLPGGIRYIGITTSSSIDLVEINYEYQYLNSSYVLNNDINIYNAFNSLEKSIKKVKDIISVSAKGLYYNNKIQNIEMTVYSGTFSNSELLYLSEVISEELVNFDNHINIRIIIKSNETMVAFINKESNSLKSNVYILGG